MCCGSASRLVIQVKQSIPVGLFREVPNSCSLISGKPGRCIDAASDAHRETGYWRAALGKEGHSDLEYTTLCAWVRPPEGNEANECSGLPGARVETGPIRKKCRVRAARRDRITAGIEGPGPGHPDGAAELVLRCIWGNQIEAVHRAAGGCRRRYT